MTDKVRTKMEKRTKEGGRYCESGSILHGVAIISWWWPEKDGQVTD